MSANLTHLLGTVCELKVFFDLEFTVQVKLNPIHFISQFRPLGLKRAANSSDSEMTCKTGTAASGTGIFLKNTYHRLNKRDKIRNPQKLQLDFIVRVHGRFTWKLIVLEIGDLEMCNCNRLGNGGTLIISSNKVD